MRRTRTTTDFPILIPLIAYGVNWSGDYCNRRTLYAQDEILVERTRQRTNRIETENEEKRTPSSRCISPMFIMLMMVEHREVNQAGGSFTRLHSVRCVRAELPLSFGECGRDREETDRSQHCVHFALLCLSCTREHELYWPLASAAFVWYKLKRLHLLQLHREIVLFKTSFCSRPATTLFI